MKSSFALLFSVLLCVLSACGTQGTNDPALDLPEVAAPSAELEPDQTAAQGEYSLAVTQTELPGGNRAEKRVGKTGEEPWWNQRNEKDSRCDLHRRS